MYEYSCTVDRVVDGDTIDVTLDLGFNILHKCRVRLYGIDTPECRTRNKDEKARGRMAAGFVQTMVEEGELIQIRTKLKDSKGKYGRVLGELIVDGTNINEAMVQKNLCVYYFGQSKADVEEEHMNNRQRLIEQGLFIPEDG
jgi:micrococcal nuclease|tara:strand:- start:488 stop:913 length:426 start_codon:yes stop_codon:yes gene_type:complete